MKIEERYWIDVPEQDDVDLPQFTDPIRIRFTKKVFETMIEAYKKRRITEFTMRGNIEKEREVKW